MGTHQALEKIQRRNIAFTLFLAGSLFFMALYHIALFGLDRREKGALFFAIMCLSITARMVSIDERVLLEILPELSFQAAWRITMISVCAAFIGSVYFLRHLYPWRYGDQRGALCRIEGSGHE